jgi:hypothetical protein
MYGLPSCRASMRNLFNHAGVAVPTIKKMPYETHSFPNAALSQ